jgi:hypothetical protein
MWLKPLLLAFFLIRIFLSPAQDTTAGRSWTGCGFTLNNNGGLGSSIAKAIEYPASSGKFALNRLDFWATGISQSGDTVAFCSDIFSSKTAWVPGPVAISGSRSHPERKNWHPFIEVSDLEVQQHRQKYDNSGYTAPFGIRNWPGAYSVSGFPTVLAPYADFDQNLVYEYDKGDYPFVPGANNLFAMGGDSAALLFGAGPSSKLDMAIIWFTPKNVDSVPGTFFFRTITCNRGTQSIHSMRIAAVADMMIGDATDNFLTTDAELGTLVGYNTAGSDAIYGNTPPAVAVGWLSEKSKNSIYFEQTNDAVKGKPVTRGHFYFLSNSYWKTGKFLSFGGSGLDGTIPASFIYSNATDASQANKDWDEVAGTAGHRTGLISYEIPSLGAKECKAADGFVSVIPDAPDSAKTKQSILGIRNFYEASDFSVGIKLPKNRIKSTQVFPNPVQVGEGLHLAGACDKTMVNIYASNGILVKVCEVENGKINVPLSEGFYYLRMVGVAPVKLMVTAKN